jgi:hypothetical protein
LLDVSPAAVALARRLVEAARLPQQAAADALHIATAACHGVDYLLTWHTSRTQSTVRESSGHAARMGTSLRYSAHRTNSWERSLRVNQKPDPGAPWRDAIVAEVRAARVALLAAAGYDLDRLAERLRQEQASSGHRVVTLPPRAPSPSTGEPA